MNGWSTSVLNFSAFGDIHFVSTPIVDSRNISAQRFCSLSCRFRLFCERSHHKFKGDQLLNQLN